MKSLLRGVVIAMVGFAVFGYAEVWGVDWELLEKIENAKSYHDKRDAPSSEKIVKVWIKQVYTEKDKNIMISLVGARYENLSYSINSLQFDCNGKLIRFLSTTNFSENGDLLGLENPSDKWEPIPPNSMFDALYKLVCK